MKDMKPQETMGKCKGKSNEEDISLSDRLNIKPATFASLRMADFSRISECMEHDFQECWFHGQLKCTHHRGQTHFSTPIRFPRVFGRGLEIGPCRDCLRMDNKQCTLSTADDRFFGIKTPNKIVVTMCRMRASRKNQFIGGKVDMMGLVVDSDVEDEDDEDELNDDREEDEDENDENDEDTRNDQNEDEADSEKNDGGEGKDETGGGDEDGQDKPDQGEDEAKDCGQGNYQDRGYKEAQNNQLQAFGDDRHKSYLNKKRNYRPIDPDSDSEREFSPGRNSNSVNGLAKNITRIPPRRRRRVLTTPKCSPENGCESRASASQASDLATQTIEIVPQNINPNEFTSSSASKSPLALSDMIYDTPTHARLDTTSISHCTPILQQEIERNPPSKNTDITNNPFSRPCGILESVTHKINRVRVMLDEKDKTLLEKNKIIQRLELENKTYVARIGRLYMEKDDLSKEVDNSKESIKDKKVDSEGERSIPGGWRDGDIV